MRKARRWAALGALSALIGALASAPAEAGTYAVSPASYAWESASTTLTSASYLQTCTAYKLDDDQAVINFTGGLTLPFAGVSYSSLRVLTNGQIQFGADTGVFRNYIDASLPEASATAYPAQPGCPAGPATNVLSVYWDDWVVNTGGAISWQQKGVAPNRYVVVTWNNVEQQSNNKITALAQAVLYEDGTIKYQYQSGSWTQSKGVIGIQVNASDYTQYSAANVPAISNGLAIQFKAPPALGSFRLTPATATASTCAPNLFTVTALKSDGTVYAGYAGSINLSTSSGHGSWSKASGGGAFSAGASDSGAASYAFAASDNGVASFNLDDQRAESLTAKAADTVAALATGTSASVSFGNNGFVVSPVDALGAEAVAGRPHAMKAEMWRRDPSTGACAIAAGYAGAKPVELWASLSASHPAGAAAPGVSANAACSAQTALPSSAPASANASLSFAAGSASFYLCPNDAGQYALNLLDVSKSFSSANIAGASAQLTARPFALAIRSVGAGALANPGGTASSGSKWIPAQSAFSATVAAVKWAPGQDSVSAGDPNPGVDLSGNALAGGFAAASSLSISSRTPAAGAAGALSGASSIPASAFAGGQATVSDLAYSEAGSIALAAASPNYLGSGYAIPSPPTGQIGRFYPAQLALSAASVSNACVSGGFTYMGQPQLGLAFTLTALGSAGGALSNYSAAAGYAYLAPVSLAAVNNQSGVDLGARLSWTPGSWVNGRYAVSQSGASFARAPSGPDGSYDALQLGVYGADADGAAVAPYAMSKSAAGACVGAGCDAARLGAPISARYGRLELASAYGSSFQPVMMGARAMYWVSNAAGAGVGWSLNTLDSCTAIPASAIVLGAPQGASSASVSGGFSFSGGKASVKVTQAPAGAAGKVDALVNLGSAAQASCAGALASGTGAGAPWLRSRFCAASYGQDPSARVTFGAYNGNANAVIFSREMY